MSTVAGPDQVSRTPFCRKASCTSLCRASSSRSPSRSRVKSSKGFLGPSAGERTTSPLTEATRQTSRGASAKAGLPGRDATSSRAMTSRVRGLHDVPPMCWPCPGFPGRHGFAFSFHYGPVRGAPSRQSLTGHVPPWSGWPRSGNPISLVKPSRREAVLTVVADDGESSRCFEPMLPTTAGPEVEADADAELPSSPSLRESVRVIQPWNSSAAWSHAERRGHGLAGSGRGLGQGRAEDGQTAVADEFVDHAAVGQDDLTDLGKVGVEQFDHVLRREFSRLSS